jgi:fatty-acyl-CoA synthase
MDKIDGAYYFIFIAMLKCLLGVAGRTSMTELLSGAAEAACGFVDTLRALYAATGFGVESLDGLVEVTRRVASGDFHPAVVWPIYAADTPDKPVLVQGERSLTWRQANARINRVANALRSTGVEPGDRIAIMLRNSIEWFEAMAGCQKVGASPVFVSYRYTAPEVRYLLENSGASLILFDVAHASIVREATAGLGFEEDRRVAVGPEQEVNGFVPYEIFLALGSEDEPPAEWRRGRSRTIFYTSGTTGKPKGAVRDLVRASPTEMLGLLRRVPFRRSDRHLVAAPLYHATGSGFATIHLSLGATLYILEKFDPIAFLATADREKITTSALVPTMLRAILEQPAEERAKFDTTSVRMIVTTGSPLPEGVFVAACETFGDVVYDLYGSTEMGHVAVASPENKRACPGTIGRPIPGVDVLLLDDRRHPVPDGEVGELFARSSLTIEGYHGDDAATRASRFGDHFSVGDLAVRDSRGYLQLVGRKTDMVISGGMNVYPAEIEAVLGAHPAIREAAVIGVPDETWGEALVAFIVFRTPAEVPANEELIAFCKKSLAGYKVPRRFERVDELPRNPTGKVLKRELRARFEQTESRPQRSQ